MYIIPKDSRLRYTKQCLFDAFTAKLEEKPVSDITVSEVSEMAGVSRKTFYKYYSDQFALLQAMQDDIFTGMQAQLEQLPPNIFEFVPALIDFADANRVVIKATLANRGSDNIIDRFVNLLYDAYKDDWQAANPNMSAQEVRFLFHYVTSGLVGIIQLWLFDYPKMSRADITQTANFLMRLSTPS
jgi:AcrR family transcriptional regulator